MSQHKHTHSLTGFSKTLGSVQDTSRSYSFHQHPEQKSKWRWHFLSFNFFFYNFTYVFFVYKLLSSSPSLPLLSRFLFHSPHKSVSHSCLSVLFCDLPSLTRAMCDHEFKAACWSLKTVVPPLTESIYSQ